MFVITVLLLCLTAVSGRLVDLEHEPRTRQGAIACSQPFVDVDGDGRASRQEVQRAHFMALGRFRHVLSALEWVVRKLPLVHIETVDEVMADCDYDQDGFISRADYDATTNSCLNNQRKIEQVYDWICVPGVEGKFQYFQEHAAGVAEANEQAATVDQADEPVVIDEQAADE
jgi:hypothetical protein